MSMPSIFVHAHSLWAVLRTKSVRSTRSCKIYPQSNKLSFAPVASLRFAQNAGGFLLFESIWPIQMQSNAHIWPVLRLIFWFWKWPQGSFSCSRAPRSSLAGRCPCSARTAGAPCWSLFEARPGKMPKNHKGHWLYSHHTFDMFFVEWFTLTRYINHAELANMDDWVSNFWDRIVWSEEYPEYPQYCPTSHKALSA